MQLSCDCQRTSECEWSFAVDEKNIDLASEGFVTLCIRNYKIGKQKCFLEIEEEKAEKILKTSVIYQEVEIDASTMPRRIKSYKSCTPLQPR